MRKFLVLLLIASTIGVAPHAIAGPREDGAGAHSPSSAEPISGSRGDPLVPQVDPTVAAIQTYLIAIGLDPGPADGVAGPKTTAAIKEYQARSGLTITGVASPELRAYLWAAIPKGAPTPNLLPGQAAPPVSGGLPPEARTKEGPRAPLPSTSSIPMKKEGGVFVIPVLINNALTLDFIVDTGAADVSIPQDVVSTLMRTGAISRSDFLGKRIYTLADGSEVPSHTFRIKSLKVGNIVVENVTGSVASENSPLLLGQSFLGRFKSWSIDNNKHVLMLE
jgi:clan AA aspartic protease (TIGR02281 family)